MGGPASVARIGNLPVESLNHEGLVDPGSPGNGLFYGAGLFVVLHACASGGAAVTGVEAISDGVPAFRPPEWRPTHVTGYRDAPEPRPPTKGRLAYGALVMAEALVITVATLLWKEQLSLPMKLAAADFVLIVSATLLLSFLATIVPARRAGSLAPVDVLRYE